MYVEHSVRAEVQLVSAEMGVDAKSEAWWSADSARTLHALRSNAISKELCIMCHAVPAHSPRCARCVT